MAKKYGRAEIFLFYFIYYFSDSVCMYVCIYIRGTLGRTSCQTSVFCQFYSMQQHADSIIRETDLVRMEVRDPEVRASNGNERESETTAKYNMHVYIVF